MSSSEKKILDTKNVNKLEPVLWNCRRYFSSIRIGCPLNEFMPQEIQLGAQKFDKENFLIKFDLKSKNERTKLSNSHKIHIPN